MRKLSDYSMDQTHRYNRGKFEAFEALGFDLSTRESRRAAAAEVICRIRAALPGPDMKVAASKYGQRFRTGTPIQGPNKRTGTLRAWWQVEPGASSPKMVTNWLEVHKEQEE